jgi:hypothetical protein
MLRFAWSAIRTLNGNEQLFGRDFAEGVILEIRMRKFEYSGIKRSNSLSMISILTRNLLPRRGSVSRSCLKPKGQKTEKEGAEAWKSGKAEQLRKLRVGEPGMR